ncbi:MAG: sigma 54-interacting transcriptional regulator [Planctomycetota bacterium]|nr:sigma 54-interacting transcriptional regulator [Planctomycetota bacterium]
MPIESEVRIEPVAMEAEFISQSAVMAPVKEAAVRAAAQASTVMILGETGTGKEMLARFVHANSPRATGPFIPVDCSALADSLFESQLFGHLKGAFTGAMRETMGFIRAADGGTLFLDEIGELSPALQAKLLRVIQERQVVPVGDTNPRPVDIRIICATHRDLSAMVADGTFRHDLYYRLHVICLHLPPLRERIADMFPLAAHFLKKLAVRSGEMPKKLSIQALESLCRYHWPGNIRELFNVLEHSFVLSENSTIIELTDLPPMLTGTGFRGPTATDLNLDNVERRAIMEALKRTRNNRANAARLLGIEPRRLNRRIDALGIPFPEGLRRDR